MHGLYEDSTNTLQPLPDSLRFRDLEASHTTSMSDMRTATDFARVLTNSIHFDFIGIALSKESQGSTLQRLSERQDLHAYFKITRDLVPSASFFERGGVNHENEIALSFSSSK